ncbi:MAG TPA: glycoside hydrolase family 99-like domain-containing protein [Ktedonobacteraceae bacterium]|nr:glycoside hydrolase family 99-like domain-containing protein [Ktedonobacteraceae bacterium]
MKRTRILLVSYLKSVVLLALVLLTLAAVVVGGYDGIGARASGDRTMPIGRPIINRAPVFPVVINRPALAFYYSWYNPQTWCSCTMSDLPTIKYRSSDESTIERQVNAAANAGITGFISSWWGQGDQTDSNLAKVLAYSATLERTTHLLFASTIYFESDAPALQGEGAIVRQLRYLVAHYANSRYFFHWQGKPVIFFWDEFGHGRTAALWAHIRSQVDPHHTMIWSAEGTDLNALSVFDGLHLFSAAYWGIQHNNIAAVDKGFRDEIDAYNKAHHTQKIWAAGVLPGYNDTRVPGRQGTYVVPRNNGATYRESWNGAVASNPDWITITSYNEWFEGSMLEPSVTYGNLYIDLTGQLTSKWRG